MSAQKAKEQLQNIVAFDKIQLKSTKDKILSGRRDIRLGTCLADMAGSHYTLAMQSLFLENDLVGFKENCYISALLSLRSIGLDGGYKYDTFRPFLVALFSDSDEVVKGFSLCELPFGSAKEQMGAVVRYLWLLQPAMVGNFDLLESRVQELRKAVKSRAIYEKDIEFFSMLMRKDVDQLSSFIQRNRAFVRSANPVDREFLSAIGCLETKLCWRLGLPVKIDSALVPMSLMPISPLGSYDVVHDFLKPDWVGPPKGWIADGIRRLKGMFDRKA